MEGACPFRHRYAKPVGFFLWPLLRTAVCAGAGCSDARPGDHPPVYAAGLGAAAQWVHCSGTPARSVRTGGICAAVFAAGSAVYAAGDAGFGGWPSAGAGGADRDAGCRGAGAGGKRHRVIRHAVYAAGRTANAADACARCAVFER